MSNSQYDKLSDEDKIAQAINFVAVDQPLPESLEVWLRRENLYHYIMNPRKFHAKPSKRATNQ